LIPFNIGGSKGGLRCTIIPGIGNLNSWAWTAGIGPNELIKKADNINM